MRGLSRADAALGVGFVLAALGEAVTLHRDAPGLLVFQMSAAPVLGVLALRRTRPVLPVCVIAAFAVLGTTLQLVLWPNSDDSGGVWIFALMLAAYSLGAHGRGHRVLLGGLLPLAVVLVTDVPTMHGWQVLNGVLFITAFVGVLPTGVGRLVRVRRDRLAALEAQRDQIVEAQRARQDSAVLAERLRTTERLQPVLLEGMRALAESADAGADPGSVEATARELLTRTRKEVVALTAPVEATAEAAPPAADHVQMLRTAAQPWAVIGAGAVAAGLALESTGTLTLATPDWVAVLAAFAVGAPLALVWWRPVAAVTVAWGAVAAFSHLVAPLDGTLSEAAFALGTVFAVAALSHRGAAAGGLVVCLVGQHFGVDAAAPLGEATLLVLCWLGGLAVNEVSRLVEQGHANNQLLADQQEARAQRAVVEERLSLAREVHDQIGHSLTVVALQASAARRLAATDPRGVPAVMATVATVAHEGVGALGDGMRQDLGALLDHTREAGLVVDSDVGDVEALGPDEHLIAYRVVQEALTNVLRHAPGARATVVLRREGPGVAITVRNSAATGTGSGPGTGRGLAGIAARVAARDGRVSWGPCADGGFEVRALLPVASTQEAAR